MPLGVAALKAIENPVISTRPWQKVSLDIDIANVGELIIADLSTQLQTTENASTNLVQEHIRLFI